MLPIVTDCVTNGDVSKKRYPEDIRTRVTKPVRRAFKQIARARKLDESDIQREAFDRYLQSEDVQALLDPKTEAQAA